MMSHRHFKALIMPCAGLCVLGVAIAFLTGAPASAQQGSAQTGPSIEDVSYAIGHDLGREVAAGLALDKVNPDIDRLAKGFADGLAGAYPELTQGQIDHTLVVFNRAIQEAQNEQRLKVDPVFRAMCDENARKSREFLERFSEKEGAKSLDGGIRYLVIDSGSGDSPTPKDTVIVTFRALLIDGLEIASGTNVPIEIDSVEDGFQRVLTAMKPGDRWYAAVPPELAFAGVGRNPDIGPNEAIVVDVDLVRIAGPDDKKK